VKIIASLTTTPYRIDLILPVILSVLNQSISIDSIEINIPYIFKRTDESYKIPEWLLSLEKESKLSNCEIRIFRTEDYGGITKVAPTLMRHRCDDDVYIWSVDDDIIYSKNMLAILCNMLVILYRQHLPKNKYVLSHSAGHWIHDLFLNKCVAYKSSRREGFFDFLEGFASVLYPSSVIDDDFEKYINTIANFSDFRNSDDIIMSNYLKLKNIKIYNCRYPLLGNREKYAHEVLDYGLLEDALHNQDEGHDIRYMRVYDLLSEMGLNYWLKKDLK
jgi:hypothetical protein